MVNHTTQEIFNQGFEEYLRTHKLPLYIHKAARALMTCRTAILGGHVQSCPDGHYRQVWYNSCKHRLCPQCAFIQIERWLIKQTARLVNCDHYHVIFTIPGELHIVWKYNVSVMAGILFSSVRKTLFELFENPVYFGAKVGVIATLHTWNQVLGLHPHIHCLITGGGLGKDGKWIEIKNGILLPVKKLKWNFRRNMINAIEDAYYYRQINLPGGMTHQQFMNLLNKIGSKKFKWNVTIMERYSHGEGVAKYLARYIRGGPIKNGRIKSYDGKKVEFIYKNRSNLGIGVKGKKEVMELTTEEFIERILLHVPIPKFKVVRYYGIYSSNQKEKLNECRDILGQSPVEEPEFLDWQSYIEKLNKNAHSDRCPKCGKRLVMTEVIPRGVSPPTMGEYKKAA